MKRKLLYLTTIVLFSAFLSINAQTTTWDFGNSTSTINSGTTLTGAWPISAGIGSSEIVKDQLGLYPIATNTNFGAVTAGAASAGQFSDGYVAPNRFQANGAGYAGTTFVALPTQRYFYFTVSGACTVKVWFKGGSTSSAPLARNVFVTDGSASLGSATSNSGVATLLTVTIPAAGKYYIYGDAANNYYKIEVAGANVTTPALGINDFQADAASNVYSNGKLVFVSNVKSDTQVDVYGISGVLVKSFKTGSDTSFDLNTGIYVVKSKSAEGEKSEKVLVN
jgi:hypothetical protein